MKDNGADSIRLLLTFQCKKRASVGFARLDQMTTFEFSIVFFVVVILLLIPVLFFPLFRLDG